MKTLGSFIGFIGVSGVAGVFISAPIVLWSLAGSYLLSEIPAAELITYWYYNLILK